MDPENTEMSQFRKLTNRKERLWRRLQDCLNLVKDLPANLEQFKVRVAQLCEVRQQFLSVLDDLAVLSDLHRSFHTDTVELESSFDSMYFEILSASARYGSDEVTPLTYVESHDNNRSKVHLPEIKIDKFDGSPEKFSAFRAANITALVDMNLKNLTDYIFLYFSLGLLDSKSRQEFEKDYLDHEFPSFDNFMQFLRNKCSISEVIVGSISAKAMATSNVGSKTGFRLPHANNNRVVMTSHEVLPNTSIAAKAVTNTNSCPACNHAHKFVKCPQLLSSSPKDRYELVKRTRRCFACLSPHLLSSCQSRNQCRHCGSNKHNSLLHFDTPSSVQNVTSNVTSNTEGQLTVASFPVEKNPASVSLVHSCATGQGNVALLATAQVQVMSSDGSWHRCRVILDSGSQSNFITVGLADRLGLKRIKCPYEIRGVGQSPLGKVRGLVDCKIHSLYDRDSYLNIRTAVLPRIIADLPTAALPITIRKRFSSLQLADPDFDKPASVDILLGVQAVLDITPTECSYLKGTPSAFLTSFGWVIMGEVLNLDCFLNTVSLHASVSEEQALGETLRAFWESEEISIPALHSPDDNACEQYFKSTTTRNNSGQYVVRLPFKENVSRSLESTREIARNRFYKLETRFKHDKEFSDLYVDNMRSYIAQNQLSPALHASPYLMSHHGVVKNTHSGKQVRVVFSPADKDSKGISLNDILLSGPKLQTDIGLTITRFRIPQVALTCDIRQMFRSIIIHPDDRKYLRILWRFKPSEPLTEWEHSRVIFGATCSPFLALRVLKQLLEDEGSRYPQAARAISSSTYVDDILSGADSIEDALRLKTELTDFLQLGGFALGKWASSDARVITDSADTLELSAINPESSTFKVLGLCWDVATGALKCKVQNISYPPSKRGILSCIARTFDINGYISPFTFTLKALIQQLWLLKVGWDDEIPPKLSLKWQKVIHELPLLENVSIPRCIWKVGDIQARLIGFSDASALGMAAVIYLRIELVDQVLVNLVASKTRVAPLKTWTIPRLELGAACLLSKLMKHTASAFDSFRILEPICFSDSTNALCWIRTPPHKLKIFYANRVVQIHENQPTATWRHVPGAENPADPASRGLLPSELLTCNLWWRGPDFYHRPEDWPKDKTIFISEFSEAEIWSHYSLVSTVDVKHFSEVLQRFSNLLKVQRIFAYILRFAHNALARKRNLHTRTGPLNASEYHNALVFAIRVTQCEYLSTELSLLRNGRPCSKNYRQLSPFISPSGLVMVGGRLRHSNLPAMTKYPYLIPKDSRLAILICDYYHIYSGHGGVRLLHSLINRTYWIPSLRRLIKNRIFRCLTCYRFAAEPLQPPMADLPSYRLQPGKCFTHTGLDFGGPFMVKLSTLRASRYEKVYIALFVCMVSRAVHIEVVTSLTTAACLAALDRFISRRGLPSHLYSDQGRNFRGAAREISEISRFFDGSRPEIAHYLATRCIRWCFNPPYAPHFGGLWEAGIKSAKFHFKRIVGNTPLSLEEFGTIVARIEGILNSRPLCASSASPDDGTDVLTPGHFLTGGPLLARAEVDLSNIPVNRVDRWQLGQQLVQAFWKRWSNEYLHTLQNKPKWNTPDRELKEGDVVLYFSPDSPPRRWPLAIVLKLLPGNDGIVRVVRLKTPTGETVRAVNKVVPLPPP